MQLAQHVIGHAQQLFALLGEFQGPMQPLEKRDPEPVFERLDLAADRRLGQRQLVGGACEAQMTSRRLEGFEQVEGGQVVAPHGVHHIPFSHATHAR